MPTQNYTISHTGSVLGDGQVTPAQNQVAPQRETTVVSFECPDNFDAIQYVGRRDATRFEPRTVESATITDDDASGDLEEGERTVALSAELQPITGETDVDEQPYPVVEAVNTTQGTTLDPETDLTIDYAANEVVVADSAVADGDTVKFYPVLTEGTIKFYTTNALGQTEGPVYPWDFPVRRFADMPQDKRGTELNLNGSVTVETFEEIEVRLDSPRQIVWEDADHPDAYVSKFEQDVSISF
jgi:hypothetical protein